MFVRGVGTTKVSEARLAQSAERKALNLVVVGSSPTVGVSFVFGSLWVLGFWNLDSFMLVVACISGLVVEYIVAIDVTGVRFPADAYVSPHVFGPWGATRGRANDLPRT